MRKSLPSSPRCPEVMKPRSGSQAEKSQSQVNDTVNDVSFSESRG